MRKNEAELLSCLFIDPSLIFKIIIKDDYFLDPTARRIFRSMQACAEKNVKIDLISVHDQDVTIDQKTIVSISDILPSAVNWEHYQSNIKKSYQLYQLSKLASYLAEVNQDSDPTEYIEEAEKRLLKIAVDSNQTNIHRLGEKLQDVTRELEERCKHPGEIPGIKTGLPYLDYMIGGLQKNLFYVIGARPSDGKSALTLNMILAAAIREKTCVGLITAESSSHEIIKRALAAEGHVEAKRFSDGTLTMADISGMVEAGSRLYNAPIYIYDAPNIRFSELKSVARQMKMTRDIKALYIDYLQIIEWDNQKLTRYEQFSKISLGCKMLARELEIPVVVPAQLGREAEKRLPSKADLKESGQIEQDADVIMLIYHPENKEGEAPKPSQIIIDKQRDGPKGMVPTIFKREYIKFYPE